MFAFYTNILVMILFMIHYRLVPHQKQDDHKPTDGTGINEPMMMEEVDTGSEYVAPKKKDLYEGITDDERVKEAIRH